MEHTSTPTGSVSIRTVGTPPLGSPPRSHPVPSPLDGPQCVPTVPVPPTCLWSYSYKVYYLLNHGRLMSRGFLLWIFHTYSPYRPSLSPRPTRDGEVRTWSVPLCEVSRHEWGRGGSGRVSVPCRYRKSKESTYTVGEGVSPILTERTPVPRG